MGSEAQTKIDTMALPRIDCGGNPLIDLESGLREVYNNDPTLGTIIWNVGKIKLTPMNRKSKGSGLNDRVCTWLLKRPNQIPEFCLGKRFFFPNTTFIDDEGDEVYRCLVVSRKGNCSTELCLPDGPFKRDDYVLSLL
jgi:hypothetical protein